MSKFSRDKGKAGEREIANIIADLTGWKIKRRVRQHDGDSDIEGIPGWSAEVKRHARATRSDIADWWFQACSQAAPDDLRPVLFYRVDRDQWRAVYGNDDSWRCIYTLTVESSVVAWADHARALHGPS